ncbi:tail protein X [Veronia pacifica]|uniref:Phage tail protein n=1 Tax=Veronia pacifica TaxID=1080227 RepID=A0A1C3ELD5_9GAMM|nr:tail protein X [Veronia pacifica]ODA34030.1 phage tail protein [Veronia pacifica]
MKVRTTEGEMLDEIVWRHYGQRPGAVEAVLTANPYLSAHGPRLPAGLIITLPEIAPPNSTQGLKLWD